MAEADSLNLFFNVSGIEKAIVGMANLGKTVNGFGLDISKAQVELARAIQSVQRINQQAGSTDIAINKQVQSFQRLLGTLDSVKAAYAAAFQPGTSNRNLEVMLTNIKKLEAELLTLGKGLQTAGVSFDTLSGKAKAAYQSIGNISFPAQSVKTLTSNINRLSGAVSQLQGATRTRGGSLNFINDKDIKNVEEFDNGIVAATARILKYQLAYLAIFGSIRQTTEAIQEFVKVNRQLADIAIVVDPLVVSLQQIKENAIELSKQFGITTNDVLESFNVFARLGLQQAQFTEATKAAFLGANTIGIDAKAVTEALTAAIFTYGIEVKDLTTILSQWLKVANEFPVSAADFVGALTSVGSAAEEVGISLQELAAITTAINAATRKSGTAIGQSLKTQLARLVRPETEQLLNQVGVAVRTSQNDFRDMGAVLDDLAKVWDGLTEVQRVNIAIQVGGIRRYVDFLALMKQYPTKIAAMASALNATNEVFRANEIVMQSVEKQLAVTARQVDEFRIAFGQALAPTILQVSQAFGSIASIVGQFANTFLGGGLISILTKTAILFTTLAVAGKLFSGTVKTSSLLLKDYIISANAGALASTRFAAAASGAAVGTTVFSRALQVLKFSISSFNPVLLAITAGLALVSELFARAAVSSERFNPDFTDQPLPSGDSLKTFTDRREAIDKEVEALQLLQSRYEGIASTISKVVPGSDSYNQALEEARVLSDNFAKSQPQLISALSKTNDELAGGATGLNILNAAIDTNIDKLREQGVALDAIIEKLKEQKTISLGINITNAKQTIRNFTNIQAALTDATKNVENFSNAVPGLFEKLDELLKTSTNKNDILNAVKTLDAQIQAVLNSARNEAQNINKLFDDASDRGIIIPDSAKDQLEQIEDRIISLQQVRDNFFNSAITPAQSYIDKNGRIVNSVEELKDSYDGLSDRAERAKNFTIGVLNNFDALADNIGERLTAAFRLQNEAERERAKLNSTRGTVDQYFPPSEEIQRFIDSIKNPIIDVKFRLETDEFQKSLRNLNALLISGGKTVNDTAAKTIQEVSGALGDYSEALLKLSTRSSAAEKETSRLQGQLEKIQGLSGPFSDQDTDNFVELEKGIRSVITSSQSRDALEGEISAKIKQQKADADALAVALSQIKLDPKTFEEVSTRLSSLKDLKISNEFFVDVSDAINKLQSQLNGLTLQQLVSPEELRKIEIISKVTGEEFSKSQLIVDNFTKAVASSFASIQTNREGKLVAQRLIDAMQDEIQKLNLELPDVNDQEKRNEINARLNSLKEQVSEEKNRIAILDAETPILEKQNQELQGMSDAVEKINRNEIEINRARSAGLELAETLKGIYQDYLKLSSDIASSDRDFLKAKEQVAKINEQINLQAAQLLTGQKKEEAIIQAKQTLVKDLLNIELDRLRTNKDIQAALQAQTLSKDLTQGITSAFLDIPDERIANRKQAAEITQQILDTEREIAIERAKGNEANLQSISDNQQKLKELKKEQKDLTNNFKEFLDFFQRTGELISKAFQDAAAKKFLVSIGLEPIGNTISKAITESVNGVLIPSSQALLDQYRQISDGFVSQYLSANNTFLGNKENSDSIYLNNLTDVFNQHVTAIARAIAGDRVNPIVVPGSSNVTLSDDSLDPIERTLNTLTSQMADAVAQRDLNILYTKSVANAQLNTNQYIVEGNRLVAVNNKNQEDSDKNDNKNTIKLEEALRATGIYIASQLGITLGAAIGGSTKGATIGSGIGGTASSLLASTLKIVPESVLGTLFPIVGNLLGGIFGGIFGSDDKKNIVRDPIIAENTKAIQALTDSLNQLDASVLNAPSNFFVPRNPGAVGNQSGPTVILNITSNNANEVANQVIRVIEDQYGRAINTSGTTRRYAI